MTTTSSSMADFIAESNISFNGGDLSSDTGVLLPLDFIFNNHLLDPYSDLPYDDERSFSKAHNSNFSILTQISSVFCPAISLRLISLFLKQIQSFPDISEPSLPSLQSPGSLRGSLKQP